MFLSMFCLMYFFILSVSISFDFYISNNSNYSGNQLEFGSNEKPFPNIITSFYFSEQIILDYIRRNNLSINNGNPITIKYNLLNSQYLILSNEIDLYLKNNTKTLFLFSKLPNSTNIFIEPNNTCENLINNCSKKSIINLKTSKFEIYIKNYLKINNLHFIGSDLSIIDENIKKRSCFNSYENCCDLEKLSNLPTNNECGLFFKRDLYKNEKLTGIFAIRQSNANITFIVEHCVFYLILSIQQNEGYFDYFLGLHCTDCNYLIEINNTVFEKVFFHKTAFYSDTKNSLKGKIYFNNSKMIQHNYFNIVPRRYKFLWTTFDDFNNYFIIASINDIFFFNCEIDTTYHSYFINNMYTTSNNIYRSFFIYNFNNNRIHFEDSFLKIGMTIIRCEKINYFIIKNSTIHIFSPMNNEIGFVMMLRQTEQKEILFTNNLITKITKIKFEIFQIDKVDYGKVHILNNYFFHCDGLAIISKKCDYEGYFPHYTFLFKNNYFKSKDNFTTSYSNYLPIFVCLNVNLIMEDSIFYDIPYPIFYSDNSKYVKLFMKNITIYYNNIQNFKKNIPIVGVIGNKCINCKIIIYGLHVKKNNFYLDQAIKKNFIFIGFIEEIVFVNNTFNLDNTDWSIQISPKYNCSVIIMNNTYINMSNFLISFEKTQNEIIYLVIKNILIKESIFKNNIISIYSNSSFVNINHFVINQVIFNLKDNPNKNIFNFDSNCKIFIKNFNFSKVSTQNFNSYFYFASNNMIYFKKIYIANIIENNVKTLFYANKHNKIIINNAIINNMNSTFENQNVKLFIFEKENIIKFENFTLSNYNLNSRCISGFFFVFKNSILIKNFNLNFSNIMLLEAFFYFNNINSIIFKDFFSNNTIFIQGKVIYCIISNLISISHSFFKNVTLHNGVFLDYNEQNKIVIQNIYFNWIYLNYINGGLLLKVNSYNSLLIKKCVFVNIFGNQNAILFFLNNENIVKIKEISGRNLLQIKFFVGGGLIFLQSNNNLTLNEVFFDNTTSNSPGSIIYANENNNIKLNNFTTNNTKCLSLIFGGGIFYLQNLNKIEIFNAKFFKTYSQEKGAIFVSFYKNYIYLKNLVMINNFAIESCIYIFNENNLLIDKNIIINTFSEKNNFLLKASSTGNILILINTTIKNEIKFIDKTIQISFIELAKNNLIKFFFCKFENINSQINFIFEKSLVLFENNDFFNKNIEEIQKMILINCLSLFKKSKFYIKNPIFLFIDTKIILLKIKIFILSEKIKNNIFEISNTNAIFSIFFINFESKLNFTFVIFFVNKNSQIIFFQNKIIKIFCLSNFKIIYSDKSLIHIKNSFYSTINILLFKNVIEKNSTSLFEINNSEINIKNTIFLGNKLNVFILFLSFNNYTKKTIFLNNIFISNKFDENKSIFYLEKSKTNSNFSNFVIDISKNIFIKNKGKKQTIFYFSEFLFKANFLNQFIFIKNNLFIQNKAEKNSFKGKGVISYFANNNIKIKNTNRILIYFINNTFKQNFASIGPLFYYENSILKNSVFIAKNNIFNNNFAYFIGNKEVSDISKLSFFNQEKKYLKYKDIFNVLSNLKINSTNCYFLISGFDIFGNFIDFTDNKHFNINYLDFKYNNNKDFNTNIIFSTNSQGILCATKIISPFLPLKKIFSVKISLKSSIIQSEIYLKLMFRACSLGEKLNTKFECEQCPPGTFSFLRENKDKFTECSKCLDSFNCFGGNMITPKKKFWRFSNNSINFFKCPKESTCLGDSKIYKEYNYSQYSQELSIGKCAEGYSGAFCLECDRNYGKIGEFLCVPCSSIQYTISKILGIVFRFFIAFFLIFLCLKTSFAICQFDFNLEEVKRSILIKLFTNHIFVMSILFNLPLNLPINFINIQNILFSFGNNLSEGLSLQCYFNDIEFNYPILYFKLIWVLIYPFILFAITFIGFYILKNVNMKFSKTVKINKSIKKNKKTILMASQSLFRKTIIK